MFTFAVDPVATHVYSPVLRGFPNTGMSEVRGQDNLLALACRRIVSEYEQVFPDLNSTPRISLLLGVHRFKNRFPISLNVVLMSVTPLFSNIRCALNASFRCSPIATEFLLSVPIGRGGARIQRRIARSPCAIAYGCDTKGRISVPHIDK